MAIPKTVQKSKTIHKILAANVGLSGVNLAAAADSLVITTALSTALATASDSGGSVPLQISPDVDTQGVYVSTIHRIAIHEDSTLSALAVDGNEVYGILSEASNAYTISFFSMINGTVTATDLPIGDYSFGIPYKFKFKDLPANALITFEGRYVGNDPAGGATLVKEVVAITALNTVADLTYKPEAATLSLNVAGHLVDEQSTTLSVSGKAITWVSDADSYDLETTDFVVAHYMTKEI